MVVLYIILSFVVFYVLVSGSRVAFTFTLVVDSAL